MDKEINIIYLESNIEIEKIYSELCFSNNLILLEKSSDLENIKNRIILAFKTFINNCVDTIKQIYSNIKQKLNEYIIQKKLNKLAGFSKYVDKAKKEGKTSFKCIDIDKVIKLLKEESDFYKKNISSFCYMYIHGFKTIDGAEKDIAKIESSMEKYSMELQQLLSTEKVYSINEAEMVVSKLTKDKEYIEILNNYTKEIRYIENYTINVIKSIDIYKTKNDLNDISGIQACITKSILYLRDHTFDVVGVIIKYLNYASLLSTPVKGVKAALAADIGDKSAIQASAEITAKVMSDTLTKPSTLKTIQGIGTVGMGIYDYKYGRNKEKNRIDDISKIYNSPSLSFR